MWPVLMEYVMSVTWAYAMLVMATLWLAGLIIELPAEYRVPSLLSGWNGVMVGTTCLIQIGVKPCARRTLRFKIHSKVLLDDLVPACILDDQHGYNDCGQCRARLLRNTKRRARWKSPDRGILP